MGYQKGAKCYIVMLKATIPYSNYVVGDALKKKKATKDKLISN